VETGTVFDMNCQEFWNRLPGQCPDALGHLRECAACAALWEKQNRLTARLREAAIEWRRMSAPPRLESRLTAAFRAQSGMIARRTPSLWVPLVSWSAAAAALLAFAFFLISRHQPQAVHHPSAVIEVATAHAVPDTDSYDEDNGFIPLPNAAQIAPNEDVNIVRVELPRSAMIELGYEVSPDRASEPVEAEVVLGADGLARAVRFMDGEMQ
jgi:hypothetical protein